MIRINQIKCKVTHTSKDLTQEIAKCLRLKPEQFTYDIIRQSLDCRPKHPLCYVYGVDVMLENSIRESALLKKLHNNNIMLSNTVQYHPHCTNKKVISDRPIVVGSGPAGLFCAYLLALNGYRPILLERGKAMEERTKDVDSFFAGDAPLHLESNVQFGEGGAGTFSDGKLNTVVKDKYGRQRFILQTFVECGAPKDILYLSKPHIGTDYLKRVVVTLRERIKQLGGEIHFSSKVTELTLQDGQIAGVVTENGTSYDSNHVVFAIGHSARDTFVLLYDQQVTMEQKPFAVGIRIEHPREQIDRLQYKEHYGTVPLPTANYKLTYQAENGRSVFTFCMCPGGYVVNASSEEGGIVVNGMSNYDRMAANSNSAIVAGVTPEDYEGEHPLAGVAFQRKLEQAAYRAGKGKLPVQLLSDFMKCQPSTKLGTVKPEVMGEYTMANVAECLPSSLVSAIIEAIVSWGRKLPGYDREDALVLGVESRTSSPVKIVRDTSFQSNIRGLYPCGEGAGYAGGIMSAAMDGMRVAEAIMGKELPKE